MSLIDAWNLVKKAKGKIRDFLVWDIKDEKMKERIEKLETRMDELQEKYPILGFLPAYADVRSMIRSYLLCVLGSATVLGVFAQWMKVLVMLQRKFRFILIPWYTLLNIPKSLGVGVFLYLAWAVLRYCSEMSPYMDEERNFEYAPTTESGSA